MKISNEQINKSVQKALVEYGVVGMKWGTSKAGESNRDTAVRIGKSAGVKIGRAKTGIGWARLKLVQQRMGDRVKQLNHDSFMRPKSGFVVPGR